MSNTIGTVDMFLAIKGAMRGKINGESQDSKHKNEIEVLGWSWGMQSRSAGGGVAATGRATIKELQIFKRVDSATTALMGALRQNEPIKEATLTIRKFGSPPLEYFTIKIEDGRVTGLDVQVDPDIATEVREVITFSFNKVEVTYVPQKGDGSGKGGMSFLDDWAPQV